MRTKLKYQEVIPILIIASILLIINMKSNTIVKIIPEEFPPFNIQNKPPDCGNWRDNMPKVREADAYWMYMNARKLWRSKLPWRLSKNDNDSILHDVRLASEKGDWGARALMEHFYLYGLGDDASRILSPDPKKAIEIMLQAVAAGIPFGYYDLGTAYENGYGEIHRNKSKAWSYYLRAAQLGSPEAQMTLADAYIKAGNSGAENLLLHCAFAQKHGPAAYQLGINSEILNKNMEAIVFYQKGVQFGCQECAASLSLLFSEGRLVVSNEETFRALGITKDPEREKRYREIADALTKNPDIRLEYLERIVPLPPKALPTWQGIGLAIEDQSKVTPTY